MNASVLVVGRSGKRLEGISTNKNKCMLELKGISLIEHTLNQATKLNAVGSLIILGSMAGRDDQRIF